VPMRQNISPIRIFCISSVQKIIHLASQVIAENAEQIYACTRLKYGFTIICPYCEIKLTNYYKNLPNTIRI
jgi:hypothetical protein